MKLPSDGRTPHLSSSSIPNLALRPSVFDQDASTLAGHGKAPSWASPGPTMAGPARPFTRVPPSAAGVPLQASAALFLTPTSEVLVIGCLVLLGVIGFGLVVMDLRSWIRERRCSRGPCVAGLMPGETCELCGKVAT